MTDAVRTLVLPFRTGDMPEPDGQWAFLNAVAHPDISEVFAVDRLRCEQTFRPDYLDLRNAGFDDVAACIEAAGEPFAGALVLLGKHRRLNEARIARATAMTRRGAPVVVAGPKTLGAASARKWIAKRTPIDGAIAKHHALVVWFGADAEAFADVALASAEPAPGFRAAPGMFSADKVDQGSTLLAARIDERISGAVADFGAGWGWLAGQTLEKGRPASLDLIEADHGALEAALDNLAESAVPIAGHWLDVAREAPPRSYDAIVMNPPFHTGRASAPDLGQRFIGAAARALVPGGRLLMVANRRLPYERTLSQHFGSVETLDDDAGFKVIAARAPVRVKKVRGRSGRDRA